MPENKVIKKQNIPKHNNVITLVAVTIHYCLAKITLPRRLGIIVRCIIIDFAISPIHYKKFI